MSQENLELAYRTFDAFERRDLDAFIAFHHPDCEIQPVLAAVAGDYHGHDGLREWWDDLFGAFPDFRFRLAEVRELGDLTLGAAHISAHGAHGMDSAAPMIDQASWIPVETRDKKILWWRNCRSEAEALEAAGLRE